VIVLCDPRITSKSYGSVFLKSLEPMPSTRSLDEVREFLLAHAAPVAEDAPRKAV
jgi:ATP-dependent DNA helicase DinG